LCPEKYEFCTVPGVAAGVAAGVKKGEVMEEVALSPTVRGLVI
jgi:hypothetical protein